MLYKALANGFYSLAYVYTVKQCTLAVVLRILSVLSEMPQIILKEHHYLYVL